MRNFLFEYLYSLNSQSMVSRPAAPESPGNLLEMHILELHPGPTELENLEWGQVLQIQVPGATDV